MTKIGFWNRLAIVASGIALLVMPLWVIVGQMRANQESRDAVYDYCMDYADEALANGEVEVYVETQQRCMAQRFPDNEPTYPGWDDWLLPLAVTAIACGVLYIFIWLSAWVVKWIWRGKSTA